MTKCLGNLGKGYSRKKEAERKTRNSTTGKGKINAKRKLNMYKRSCWRKEKAKI